VLMIVDVAAGSATATTPRAGGAVAPGAERGTGREVDDVRRCACGGVDGKGCSEPMDGARPDALYASSACRTRAWKRRTGYRDPRRGKASRNGAPPRARRPSLRISYHKALAALEEEFTAYGFDMPYTTARAILRPLLSESARRHVA
jgi:hypothetical protein